MATPNTYSPKAHTYYYNVQMFLSENGWCHIWRGEWERNNISGAHDFTSGNI